MIIGMIAASTPRKPKRLSNFLKAPIALSPVFLPIAISAIINEKPNVTARIRYTRRNVPPPYFAARYGNLQRLPSPTADPAAASTNPILLEKLLLCDIKNPPQNSFRLS